MQVYLLVSESRYWYHKDAVLKEELHINTHSWFLLSWEEMLRPLERCGELMYDGPVQSLRLCVLMPERIGVFLPLFGICSFDNVKHWCTLCLKVCFQLATENFVSMGLLLRVPNDVGLPSTQCCLRLFLNRIVLMSHKWRNSPLSQLSFSTEKPPSLENSEWCLWTNSYCKIQPFESVRYDTKYVGAAS